MPGQFIGISRSEERNGYYDPPSHRLNEDNRRRSVAMIQTLVKILDHKPLGVVAQGPKEQICRRRIAI
jgi:hypothetical protein